MRTDVALAVPLEHCEDCGRLNRGGLGSGGLEPVNLGSGALVSDEPVADDLDSGGMGLVEDRDWGHPHDSSSPVETNSPSL